MSSDFDFEYMKEIIEECAIKTFNKVMFEYSISQTTIINQILELEKEDDQLIDAEKGLDEEGHVFAEHFINTHKHLKNLLLSITNADENESYSANELLEMPKFYDETLLKSQLAARMTLTIFLNSFKKHHLYNENIAVIEISGNRAVGATFPEAMLLSLLSVTTKNKALKTINTPRDTPDKKKKARKWIRDNGELLFSLRFYEILSRTFLGEFEKAVYEEYQAKEEECARKYLLDDRHKKRKDLLRAVKASPVAIKEESSEEMKLDFNTKARKVLAYRTILERIIKCTEDIVEKDCDKFRGIKDMSFDDYSKVEKETALFLKNIMNAFIITEQRSVCEILSEFTEGKEIKEKSIYDYLNKQKGKAN